MRCTYSLVAGVTLALSLSVVSSEIAYGQTAEPILEEVVVTGSRIRQNPLNQPTALMNIGSDQLDRSGVTNLGDILQDLPITGSAPNSQFNVPGNSGFPQDGAGIGAGGVQLSLRNIGAKRTLILVDGKRWIAGSSASGVPSTVDLNTLPANVIDRIEILQDGASAIYGSDAIGGVVNIITNADFDGFRLDVQTGEYLSDNDGSSSDVSALWGGGNDRTHFVVSLSYTEEKGIDTASRKRSRFPNPDSNSCDIPGTFCSSFTPQARVVLGPNFGFTDVTLNDGVLNDGGANVPVFDPADPFADDFHAFSGADRFNYNGPGFNYLRTPNERTNIYTSLTHDLTDTVRTIVRASYTKRKSQTKAAPEPLCLGNDCGNRISDNFFISSLNPYNPFGVDLSVANGNLEFIGRRPLESGRRLFFQDVDSYFISVGLEGTFVAGERNFYWDLTGSYGDNSGFQEKKNSHNIAKIQTAMGDPAVCAAVPNCVPFNIFGGQGPNGTGSITQEMLDFVTYTQRDFSEQTLKDVSFNITGEIMSLPAGELSFAAGFEYRDHEGSYRPDPIAASGETAGIPAGPTFGQFDVTEFYGELKIPLLYTSSQFLEANVAARSSDYSTSGSESTYKAGFLYKPMDDLSLRGSISTGFRAPGIGELFGGAAREDFTFTDPCADYTGVLGSANGGRDVAQSATIQANCATLGVPAGLAQLNPQLNAVSAGNENLDAETSDAWSVGVVYSPDWVANISWIESLTASIDFYDLEIDDAVQGRSPADVITACVDTLDPAFCSSVPRTSSGRVGLVNNQLQNIGTIETSGYDVAFSYASPSTDFGQFFVSVNATHLSDYTEITANADGTSSSNDLTGIHTDETFARAFPDWRAVTSVDWIKERWSGSLTLRWTDEMTLDSGNKLDSVIFTDVQVQYNPPFADDGLTVTVGLNNALDEDPPVCFPCGVIGLSTVSHDLPGRVGYVRVSYQLPE
ncbi:MAG: TonB-dependent receptor [Gammaproteobacteria bacterium]|nr:TonB-dependent receptor [Gammaproteobacteria bacterium]